MRNISEEENMSSREPASSWARWGGYALVLAGGLWIITYVAGVADRRLIDPDYFDGSALMWVGMIANEAAQTRALPRLAAWLLLLVGVLTVPLIFLAFPLGSVAPNYLVSDLPLVLVAVLLVLIGIAARRRWHKA